MWTKDNLLKTDDGTHTMVHPKLGEAFHSKSGALSESKQLYVDKSGIRESFATSGRVRVLDVGLGLGYNALATFDAWSGANSSTELEIVSLEYDQTLVEQFKSGDAPWQIQWQEGWKTFAKGSTVVGLSHKIIVGDAREYSDPIPFDYIWQDPFSPKKNPDLWSRSWFEGLRGMSHSTTTLMTYSVARTTRDHLIEAGWSWDKISAGKGAKRHWLTARPKRSE